MAEVYAVVRVYSNYVEFYCFCDTIEDAHAQADLKNRSSVGVDGRKIKYAAHTFQTVEADDPYREQPRLGFMPRRKADEQSPELRTL